MHRKLISEQANSYHYRRLKVTLHSRASALKKVTNQWVIKYSKGSTEKTEALIELEAFLKRVRSVIKKHFKLEKTENILQMLSSNITKLNNESFTSYLSDLYNAIRGLESQFNANPSLFAKELTIERLTYIDGKAHVGGLPVPPSLHDKAQPKSVDKKVPQQVILSDNFDWFNSGEKRTIPARNKTLPKILRDLYKATDGDPDKNVLESKVAPRVKNIISRIDINAQSSKGAVYAELKKILYARTLDTKRVVSFRFRTYTESDYLIYLANLRTNVNKN